MFLENHNSNNEIEIYSNGSYNINIKFLQYKVWWFWWFRWKNSNENNLNKKKSNV